MERQPMDLATYSERAQHGPYFICRLVASDPAYAHEIVYEDDAHLAFLDKWPVLPASPALAENLIHAGGDGFRGADRGRSSRRYRTALAGAAR
jgi:hypothetical protein